MDRLADSVPRSPAELIALVDRSVDAVILERLRTKGYAGVTAVHARVFEALYFGAARITELARYAGVTKQSMGELVATLESRGYVRREPHPADRRATLVRLTHKGRASIAVAVETLAEIESGWKARLGEERYRALNDALAELAEAD